MVVSMIANRHIAGDAAHGSLSLNSRFALINLVYGLIVMQ